MTRLYISKTVLNWTESNWIELKARSCSCLFLHWRVWSYICRCSNDLWSLLVGFRSVSELLHYRITRIFKSQGSFNSILFLALFSTYRDFSRESSHKFLGINDNSMPNIHVTCLLCLKFLVMLPYHERQHSPVKLARKTTKCNVFSLTCLVLIYSY